MAPRDYVTFQFRLPPALLLRAPVGLWPRAPRGATLVCDGDGVVIVTSLDHSELYARDQVMRVAAAFLRFVGDCRRRVPQTLQATLTPSNGEQPIHYAISLDASVSIARTREPPAVFGEMEERPSLAVVR